MSQFCIGKYTYFGNSNCYCIESNGLSSQAKIVKDYDQVLRQSLDKIFHERCSSSSSSNEFKKNRCNPQDHSDWKSIIRPVLDQEPVLSRCFSKEELGKLSLLWISILAGYEKSSELLVRSGADVNELFGRRNPQIVDEKWTVLHMLVQMDPSPENDELIRLIMDHGANLQTRDHRDKTALHYVIKHGRVQIAKMLLEKGANVNIADNEGMTPLLDAVRNCKANELVPLLMKHGADVFAKNRRGLNVLHHLAFDRIGNVEIARLFIEKGVSLLDEIIANRNQPVHVAAINGNFELVKLFLDHGANVNVQNVSGESPLYLASAQSYSISQLTMETLLKRGSNIKLKTTRGHTALHGICKKLSFGFRYGKEYAASITATIRLLLISGSDVLAEDEDGNTPLAITLEFYENREPPGTRLLIKALAWKKALQPLIELKDERIIERHPPLQDYYQDCIEQIDRMKSKRFISTCSFFELFTKSYSQIAVLMRNPNFEIKFKQCDLSGFSTYAEDIHRAFERAHDYYQWTLKQENVINEAFYNTLPYLVVEKLVYYIDP